MKKILICLAFLNFYNLGHSQNYFSTSVSSNDFVHSGGVIKFNNKNLIITSEFCGGFGGNDCGHVLEIENDGSISYIHELDDIFLYDKSFISNDDRLTIVGRKDNNSITILQFDTSMNQVQQQTYNVSATLWIYDVIEYAGYFVVAAYNYGSTNNSNFPRLYWFDATDLSLDYVYMNELNISSFRELAIDSENNLRVFNSRNDEQFILKFNTNKELIDALDVSTSDTIIGNLNFEMIQDDQVLFGLVHKKHLQCYSSGGQLNWEKNIASAFGISEIRYIQQLKEVANGDILLCGGLQRNGFNYGFIYMLSSTGSEKWKRIYSVNGSLSNWLKGFTEISNDEYLFYGTSRLVYVPTTTAHDSHWAMKTDANGCIENYCGNEITIVSTNESRFVDIETYPNPVATQFSVERYRIRSTRSIPVNEYDRKYNPTRLNFQSYY